MKSHFIKRNHAVHSQSFSVRHDRLPHFLKLWHHHQELEIVLNLQGAGTRFVGDSIEPFGPGDLVLLGDQLPHQWQNQPEYFRNEGLVAEAIIIHFEKDFLAGAIEQTVELAGIHNLLNNANRGIRFLGSTCPDAERIMREIVALPSGLERLIKLLELLKLLSEEKDYEYLASQGYAQSVYEVDLKLKKVNEYVMNHFQSRIVLGDVSNEVCMNKSAFCRYFKKATQKSFSQYLNQIRIGFACKLLQTSPEKSIAQVCYESGFNNLSNFNEKFKQYTGRTPSVYATSGSMVTAE